MVDDKKQEGQPAAKKAGLLENKVVVLGGVVAMQLVLAVVLTMVVIMPNLGTSQASQAQEMATPTADEQPMGVLLSLGEIIVTLQGSGPSGHYLRITVDLELRDQKAADLAATRLPVMRDTVIMTLTDRSAADINRPEGMKGLRDELMRRLSERLPTNHLQHIYFSDLVVQ